MLRVFIEVSYVVVVVVALLLYVHGKHLRSCRDGRYLMKKDSGCLGILFE